FILLKEERSLASPTGSLYYEFYADEGQVREELALRSEEIQCVVSRKDVPFGHSQRPALWDYADGVDTLSFLTTLL
ncbi:MAG: acyl-CoA reductase, partial [Flavobacteriales bacterium]